MFLFLALGEDDARKACISFGSDWKVHKVTAGSIISSTEYNNANEGTATAIKINAGG